MIADLVVADIPRIALLEWDTTTELYEVMAPLTGRFNGELVTVPEGTFTNLASIPQIVVSGWVTGGKSQKHLIPSIFHDYFYSTARFPREVADEYYRLMMLEVGTPRWRAWIMHRSTRIGGAKHYNKGKRK